MLARIAPLVPRSVVACLVFGLAVDAAAANSWSNAFGEMDLHRTLDGCHRRLRAAVALGLSP